MYGKRREMAGEERLETGSDVGSVSETLLTAKVRADDRCGQLSGLTSQKSKKRTASSSS